MQKRQAEDATKRKQEEDAERQRFEEMQKVEVQEKLVKSKRKIQLGDE